MSDLKEQAIEAIDELHSTIPYEMYCAVHDGLTEIEPLAERDAELEALWAEFGDIPMNPETECMEAPFLGLPAGTHREEVWHWFDERHSRGVHYLMYHDVDSPEWYSWTELLQRDAMCFECESKACCLNDDGLCCYPFVHAKKPTITEEDAIAEGAEKTYPYTCPVTGKTAHLENPYGTYRDGFACLWDSLNEKRGFGWEANPWVWVYEFERISKEEAGAE